jgi:hypothetical protein
VFTSALGAARRRHLSSALTLLSSLQGELDAVAAVEEADPLGDPSPWAYARFLSGALGEQLLAAAASLGVTLGPRDPGSQS